jgi:hypothetical protein
VNGAVRQGHPKVNQLLQRIIAQSRAAVSSGQSPEHLEYIAYIGSDGERGTTGVRSTLQNGVTISIYFDPLDLGRANNALIVRSSAANGSLGVEICEWRETRWENATIGLAVLKPSDSAQ